MTDLNAAGSNGFARGCQYSLRTALGFMAVASVLATIGARAGWGTALVILISVVVIASISILRSVQLVRLYAAVGVAVAACWFVVRYDFFARAQFEFDHPGERLTEMRITEFIAAHAVNAYAVPIAAFVVGVLILYFRPNSPVLLELLMSSLWVLAFAWVLCIILVWQMQNVPIFSGMRWHY
jgi:hypothetical protein